MHLPALLPEDYLPDVQMRLVHYKRISSVSDEEALRQLQVELIDRFGLLPDPTRNLFRQTRLRLRAAVLGIRKIEGWPTGATIEFEAKPSVDPARIITLIQTDPQRYSFDSKQRLRLTADLELLEDRFDTLEELISMLGMPADDAIAMSV